MLGTEGLPKGTEDAIDRLNLLRPLRNTENQQSTYKSQQLHKSSSSVLLTLAIPERSVSREEELLLLKNPKGLWTVLAVNCSMRAFSDEETQKYLTPMAQYLRGIAVCLRTQRTNAE